MGRHYIASPSNGQHWLVEAADLEVGTGYYHSRSFDPALAADPANASGPGAYYRRFNLKIEDAAPALAAAYPDRKYSVGQHGSAFYCFREA